MGKEQDNDVQNFIQNALKILNIDPSLTNLLLTISSVFFVKGLFVFVSKYWSANMAISLKKKNHPATLISKIFRVVLWSLHRFENRLA